MTVFMWSAIFVIVILCAIAAYTTMAVAKQVEQEGELDAPIEQKIVDHPFLWNPIILMYIVVGIFMTIVIFGYYVAYR